MSISLIPIPAFSDNYIWLITDGKKGVVVDPGDAAPVLDYLKNYHIELIGILITHHHWDHTGGNPKLLEQYPDIPVWGPAHEDITTLTNQLNEDDQLDIGFGFTFKVIDVPGHTSGHIAYYSENVAGSPLLLSGDTLFSSGCGRLFEGTPEQMYSSLNKLRKLPDETLIYCTHEYTASNLVFAAAVEPQNDDIAARIKDVATLRAAGKPSLPTQIGLEKNVNPFLRWDSNELQKSAQTYAGKTLSNDTEVFAAVRAWKDNF